MSYPAHPAYSAVYPAMASHTGSSYHISSPTSATFDGLDHHPLAAGSSNGYTNPPAHPMGASGGYYQQRDNYHHPPQQAPSYAQQPEMTPRHEPPHFNPAAYSAWPQVVKKQADQLYQPPMQSQTNRAFPAQPLSIDIPAPIHYSHISPVNVHSPTPVSANRGSFTLQTVEAVLPQWTREMQGSPRIKTEEPAANSNGGFYTSNGHFSPPYAQLSRRENAFPNYRQSSSLEGAGISMPSFEASAAPANNATQPLNGYYSPAGQMSPSHLTPNPPSPEVRRYTVDPAEVSAASLSPVRLTYPSSHSRSGSQSSSAYDTESSYTEEGNIDDYDSTPPLVRGAQEDTFGSPTYETSGSWTSSSASDSDADGDSDPGSSTFEGASYEDTDDCYPTIVAPSPTSLRSAYIKPEPSARFSPYVLPSQTSAKRAPPPKSSSSSSEGSEAAPAPASYPRGYHVLPTPIPVPNLIKKSRGRRVPTATSNDLRRVDPCTTGAPTRGGRGSKGVRAHMCEVAGCGKCFARGEHLKRHVRSIHTYEKPHKCQFPGCKKDFSRHDNLNQHMRVHKDWKPPVVLGV